MKGKVHKMVVLYGLETVVPLRRRQKTELEAKISLEVIRMDETMTANQMLDVSEIKSNRLDWFVKVDCRCTREGC